MASKKSTPKFDPKLYAKRVSALYDDWKVPPPLPLPLPLFKDANGVTAAALFFELFEDLQKLNRNASLLVLLVPHPISSSSSSSQNPQSQDVWKNIGALVVANGTPDEEIIYKKSTALQDWFFGFELENTVMVFTEREVHVLTTKPDLLAGIADARPDDRPELSTTLHAAEVGQDNTQHFDKLLSVIRDNLEGVRLLSPFLSWTDWPPTHSPARPPPAFGACAIESERCGRSAARGRSGRLHRLVEDGV
jgi:hypothetical protein